MPIIIRTTFREADDRSKASDKNNCQISEDDI